MHHIVQHSTSIMTQNQGIPLQMIAISKSTIMSEITERKKRLFRKRETEILSLETNRQTLCVQNLKITELTRKFCQLLKNLSESINCWQFIPLDPVVFPALPQIAIQIYKGTNKEAHWTDTNHRKWRNECVVRRGKFRAQVTNTSIVINHVGSFFQVFSIPVHCTINFHSLFITSWIIILLIFDIFLEVLKRSIACS